LPPYANQAKRFPVDQERERIRAWLKEAISQAGGSAAALAKRAGLADTTITRFLKHEDAPMPSSRTLSKIAHAAGLKPIGFSSDTAAALDVPGVAEPEALQFDMEEAEPRQTRLVRAAIGDRQAADPWILKTVALKLAGYMPGDIVIVDLVQSARAGSAVCAQIYDWRQNSAETVFRIYEPPFLVAASDNPVMRRPRLVDNENVIIKGVITEVLRLI